MKILPPLLPGFELATFHSRARSFTNKLPQLPHINSTAFKNGNIRHIKEKKNHVHFPPWKASGNSCTTSICGPVCQTIVVWLWLMKIIGNVLHSLLLRVTKLFGSSIITISIRPDNVPIQISAHCGILYHLKPVYSVSQTVRPLTWHYREAERKATGPHSRIRTCNQPRPRNHSTTNIRPHHHHILQLSRPVTCRLGIAFLKTGLTG